LPKISGWGWKGGATWGLIFHGGLFKKIDGGVIPLIFVPNKNPDFGGSKVPRPPPMGANFNFI